MRTLVTSYNVDAALRNLGSDDQLQVKAWFRHLQTYDTDEYVRSLCVPLKSMAGWYVFRTTSEFRIFFRFDGDAIVVEEIATKRAILSWTGRAE